MKESFIESIDNNPFADALKNEQFKGYLKRSRVAIKDLIPVKASQESSLLRIPMKAPY